MVVGDNQGGGVAPECRQHHLAGIDGVPVTVPSPAPRVDDRMGGVQVDRDKACAAAPQQVDQVVGTSFDEEMYCFPTSFCFR